MSERALRGTRLVVTSYETDRGIDLAPRQAVEYACQNGHRFEMPFSVEAEIPPEWECKACGAVALLVDGDGPEEKKGKPARTHWDMLMERRTREELEEVLAERLAVLRSGAMNIAVHPRDNRKSALQRHRFTAKGPDHRSVIRALRAFRHHAVATVTGSPAARRRPCVRPPGSPRPERSSRRGGGSGPGAANPGCFRAWRSSSGAPATVRFCGG